MTKILGEKVLRREIVVATHGYTSELEKSDFPDLTIEVESAIKDMPVSRQKELAQSLSELSIASGLLVDPFVIAKEIEAVILVEVAIGERMPDGKQPVTASYLYANDPLPYNATTSFAQSFFKKIGRALDDQVVS